MADQKHITQRRPRRGKVTRRITKKPRRHGVDRYQEIGKGPWYMAENPLLWMSDD